MGIEWRIVVPCGSDDGRRNRAASLNIRPRGKDLVTIAYGRDLRELEGIKRGRVSFWAIDESGSVGRSGKSLGKAITYSAVTQLGDVDYRALFDGIPLSTDRAGHSEVHYRDLRRYDPQSLEKVVGRVGEAPLLILSLPIEKRDEDTRRSWVKPKNAGYVFAALFRIIRAIEQVDLSDTVIVTFDRTDDMEQFLLDVPWSERIVVRMGESYAARLYQVADLAASVTGNAINYPEELDERMFWSLFGINTNVSSDRSSSERTSDRRHTTRPHVRADPTPDTLRNGYLKDSRKNSNTSARDSVTTASKPDGTDIGTTSKNYKRGLDQPGFRFRSPFRKRSARESGERRTAGIRLSRMSERFRRWNSVERL